MTQSVTFTCTLPEREGRSRLTKFQYSSCGIHTSLSPTLLGMVVEELIIKDWRTKVYPFTDLKFEFEKLPLITKLLFTTIHKFNESLVLKIEKLFYHFKSSIYDTDISAINFNAQLLKG